MDKSFWKDKRVFLTGHTGFKGSWLTVWLDLLGAKVTGYALPPYTKPSLFKLCRNDEISHSIISDIRDANKLSRALKEARPDIVIHMAAQPIVRESYRIPRETFDINVMGTVNLFEAVRGSNSVKTVLNVTTDKCYENRESPRGYKEIEPLGGHDPYSASKACSELVTSAYRLSFFNENKVGIASARAGNVIGGGDWAQDRLVPDFIRAILKGDKISIRNPKAVRPWQHVLDSLGGYMTLIEKLYKHGEKYSGAWNFGPAKKSKRTVQSLVKCLCDEWGEDASYAISRKSGPHETGCLQLDISKARTKLGWKPKWDIDTSIGKIIEWTRRYSYGDDPRDICAEQINEYMEVKK